MSTTDCGAPFLVVDATERVGGVGGFFIPRLVACTSAKATSKLPEVWSILWQDCWKQYPDYTNTSAESAASDKSVHPLCPKRSTLNGSLSPSPCSAADLLGGN